MNRPSRVDADAVRISIWRIRVRLVSAAVCIFVLASAVSVEGAGDSKSDRRHALRYTEGDETVYIVRVKDKEWLAKRGDGRTIEYDELERTEDYIELRNRSSKLHIRLRHGRCHWRQENGTDWKGWVMGEWVDRPPVPALETPVPEASAPETSLARDYRVRLAYFVPEDRTPAANYEQKITLIMTAVAELYRSDLLAKGYRTAGLKLEQSDGRPVIHLVRGSQRASHYNNAPAYDAQEQWRRLVPEIRTQVGDPRRQLIVAFAETYDDGPADHHWPGVLALGAYYSADGGLAIYSSFLLRDEFCALTVERQRPLFFDQTPVPGRRALGHGPNSPRCEFVEDGFGAVAHELGHALGLPHDQREDDRDIMGNGFRNLRWNFLPAEVRGRRVGFSEDNGRLLACSRYISPDIDATDNEPPTVEMTINPQRNRQPEVSVKAFDNTVLRAIVLYDENAGTVVAGRRLQGAVQELRISLPAAVFRSNAVKLMAIVTDQGGNQTRISASL